MNRTLSVLAVVLAIVAAGWLAGGTSVGQGPAEETDETASAHAGRLASVGLVSMQRVFKENKAFQTSIEAMKEEIQAYSKNVAVRSAEIESLTKKQANLNPGTADYEKAQLLLTRLQTELKLETTRRKQDFLNRETTLYRETYDKVSAAVARYAKENGIQLVLRSGEQSDDQDDRKTVMGAVNRMVVYQDGLDITDAIVAAVNADGEPPAETP